jgi:hypothetical protein
VPSQAPKVFTLCGVPEVLGTHPSGPHDLHGADGKILTFFIAAIDLI